MIWSIVNKLLSTTSDKYYYEGLDEDLFQEGYIGLLLAYEKYDKTLNVQFITYAYKCVYGYCQNYLKKEYRSLNNLDIDNSPKISEETYEIDNYSFDGDLIEEINKQLRITNRKLLPIEENILRCRLYKEFSLEKCAELNKCSTKKVNNVIEKYKNLIKYILTN